MCNVKRGIAFVSFMLIGSMYCLNVGAEELEKQTYEIEAVSDEEVVIIDNEKCIMKIESIEPEGEWGYTWQVCLENKTDKEIMFDMTDVSVNGMMCDPYWSVAVEPDMKANEEIIWDAAELELYGINEVTVVEFTLNVYDNEDWEAGNLVYDDYIVYLNGKEAAVYVERVTEETDTVWFDTEECSMVMTGFEEDGVWGTELNVYFENKSEKDLLVSLEDVSVNGMMCDPYWGTVVTAGNNAYASISWMEEDLEMNEIEQIEEIQGMIYVYDNDDWEADALVEKEIVAKVVVE